MSDEMTEQLIRKLGLQDEPGLLNKTKELFRLLDIKSSTASSHIGDYGKTVILIDLAAANLGIPFENVEDALKISNIRKSAYQNYKRTFEKLLDINKLLSIDDICTQIGLNEVAEKAKKIFDIYKKSVDDKENNIDTSHPQYLTMAIYQACKLKKVKLSKTKLLPYSHLKPAQWTRLEEQWTKILGKIQKKDLDKILTNKNENTKNSSINNNINENNDDNSIKSKKHNEPEDYQTWKIRMLTKAFKEYMESKNMDTTNFELPPIDDIRISLSPTKKKNAEKIVSMDES